MVTCEVVGWLYTLLSPSCPAPSLWQDKGNDSCQLYNCSTVAGSKHNPLTHVWLQVLFNQVLPTFLPLLIWSHFITCLHRANSIEEQVQPGTKLCYWATAAEQQHPLPKVSHAFLENQISSKQLPKQRPSPILEKTATHRFSLQENPTCPEVPGNC